MSKDIYEWVKRKRERAELWKKLKSMLLMVGLWAVITFVFLKFIIPFLVGEF